MREIDIKFVQQRLAAFEGLLETAPGIARAILKSEPAFAMAYSKVIAPVVWAAKLEYDWIRSLFHTYLSPIEPAATAVCLGVGNGEELFFLREVITSGNLFGVDKKISKDAILAELTTSSELIKQDLTAISPDRVILKIGLSPDILVCRHPNTYVEPKWPKILTEWSQIVSKNQGKMLITTLFEEERKEIVSAMKNAGMNPREDIFEPGRKVINSDFGVDIRTSVDRFVILLEN